MSTRMSTSSAARSGSTSASQSSSSSSNTWPVVTTTAAQVIPSSSTSYTPGSSSNKSFPTAAIAVVAVIGGIAAIFIAYRVYVWVYKRRFLANGGGAPLPEARPAGGDRGMSMAYGSQVGLMSAAARDSSMLGPRRNNSSFSGYATTDGGWGGLTYGLANEKEPMSPLSPPTGVYTPSPPGSASGGNSSPISPGAGISREGSPFGSAANNASRNSLAAIPHSQSNRNSIASSYPSRRSMYGPNALYNGPQMRSNHSSNRLSGAPHAPHSRIDIVPPLPLAPPPGTVVATDKSSLDFAPSAGLGKGLGASVRSDWYPGNPGFDAGKVTPTGSSSGHGSRSTPDSSQHSFPPTPRGRDTRGGHEHPRASTGSMSPPSVTSPLDKLQQRIMTSAQPTSSQSRSSSASGGGPFASGSSGRVSRDEGPFAGGSSSGGSDKREFEEVGNYEAPSARLDDMMVGRRAEP